MHIHGCSLLILKAKVKVVYISSQVNVFQTVKDGANITIASNIVA